MSSPPTTESSEPLTYMEIQRAIATAKRIVGKADTNTGHYPGALEQLNLARCFLAAMETASRD